MRTSLLLIAGGVMCCSVLAANALPATPGLSLPSQAEKASFWGRPFPYRYSWSRVRACTRYLPVETERGVVWQRTWVCRR